MKLDSNKRINIRESQYKRVLREYHHAYGNGLEQDAENIANIAIDMYSKHNGQKISPYHIESLDVDIEIRLVNGYVCACSRDGDFINVAIGNIEDALQGDKMQRLVSLIYHELGHLTNTVKSDFSLGETDIDFKTPLFLGMNDDEYKQMQTILYRFYTREMKARCFETAMFLKKNTNPNITIQDVYNDRCSDITLMRGFIKLLEIGAEQGPESEYGKILDGLSRRTWESKARWHRYDRRNKDGKFVDKISWRYKCKNTINFFTQKYLWLKKRIDKIFYDYKSGNVA